MRGRYWNAVKKALVEGDTRLGVKMIMAVVGGNSPKEVADLLRKAEK